MLRWFESTSSHHKPVTKKMSQAFFFAVSSKIGNFANRFLDTILQCCPTILGRFPQLDAHFFCRFLEFGRGGAIFLRKNRINPAVFRMFSISSQPISCWLRGFFCFFRQFSFCFQVFHFIPIYNKEDFHHEYHYRHRPRLLRHQNSPLLVRGRADKLRRTRTLHPPRTLRVWRVLFCLWHRAAAYPAG